MLDAAFMLGAIPQRFKDLNGIEQYFAMARGNKDAVAMEMTKWLNTNYHYIVPELSLGDEYKLNAKKIVDEYNEAKSHGIKTKINIISPLTFLLLSKIENNGDPFDLLPKVLPVYVELLEVISRLDDEVIVQFDEPILVKGADGELLSHLKSVYDVLGCVAKNIKIAVVTYFENINESIETLCKAPIWAIGLDLVYGKENIEKLDCFKDSGKLLIAGIVEGRNIWKNDIDDSLNILTKISEKIKKENILISTSCSLLHVPYSLKSEEKLDEEIKEWLSFAVEKLDEVSLISKIFFEGVDSLDSIQKSLYENSKKVATSRKNSKLIHDTTVQQRVSSIIKKERDGKFEERIKTQKEALKYGNLATTTIGSFPQTPELRHTRLQYKKGAISKEDYEKYIRSYIDECISLQEEIGLDVLVHGEPERNDMVEFFGERLNGYGFTNNGWVQSYGSRCVKPPFIYGDVSR